MKGFTFTFTFYNLIFAAMNKSCPDAMKPLVFLSLSHVYLHFFPDVPGGCFESWLNNREVPLIKKTGKIFPCFI